MPRQIVNLGKGNPAQNADQNLIDLINANANALSARASNKSASAAGRTASLKERKFLKELTDEQIKIQGIPDLIKALQTTTDKDFVEGGHAENLTRTLQGIVTPSQGNKGKFQKVVSPNQNEDQDVTNIKQAATTTIPEAIPADIDDSDFSQEFLDEHNIKPLTPAERKEAQQFDEFLKKQQRQEDGLDISEEDVTFNGQPGVGGPRDVDASKSTLGPGQSIRDVTPEDISFKEQNPNHAIPAEDPELNPGEVKDLSNGAVYRRGPVMPVEKKTPILNALSQMHPAIVNQLMQDKTFGPAIQSVLTEKPASQLVIEKLIDTAAKANDHGKVMKDDAGNLLMVDLSGASPQALRLNGQTGSAISALSKTEVGQKFINFLLSKGGITPKMLQENKDGAGNPLDSKNMSARFQRWLEDKDFTKTQTAIEVTKLYLKSQELATVRTLQSATANIMSAVSLPAGLSSKTVSDQVLVTMFNKLTDPKSVVREGEFERIFNLRNLPGKALAFVDSLKNMVTINNDGSWRLKPGSALSEIERDTIIQFGLHVTINELAKSSGGLGDIIDLADTNAAALNINPNQIVPKSMREQVHEARLIRARMARNDNDIIKTMREVKTLLKRKKRSKR